MALLLYMHGPLAARQGTVRLLAGIVVVEAVGVGSQGNLAVRVLKLPALLVVEMLLHHHLRHDGAQLLSLPPLPEQFGWRPGPRA